MPPLGTLSWHSHRTASSAGATRHYTEKDLWDSTKRLVFYSEFSRFNFSLLNTHLIGIEYISK